MRGQVCRIGNLMFKASIDFAALSLEAPSSQAKTISRVAKTSTAKTYFVSLNFFTTLVIIDFENIVDLPSFELVLKLILILLHFLSHQPFPVTFVPR